MQRTEEEYIRSVATYDENLDHEDGCGVCYYRKCMADAAKQILATGNFEDAMGRQATLVKELWEQGKYYKFYLEEKAAGRNPKEAFDEKGWEM